MQSSVHKQAAIGFQTAADAYERGRPEYPPSAIQYLIETLGINSFAKECAAIQ